MRGASILPATHFRAAWLLQVQANPWVSVGLGLSLLMVCWLVGSSVYYALMNGHSAYVCYALCGGVTGLAATAAGAWLAMSLRRISVRAQDCMLGFAAGMMLAASSFSLILPGIAAAYSLTGSQLLAPAVVVFGLTLGVLLMLGLDRLTPHEHVIVGPCGPDVGRINRVWLFVLAITLHNLPEGMAIGVGFSRGDWNVGIPLAAAIAIQDIPEGLAVTMALRSAGVSAGKAVWIAAASGLMEPLGALLGIGLSSGFEQAYPISMGLAAGAMLFVVSHEIIPETHRNGHQTPATLGLMGGFAVMMFLDTALG